MIRWLSMVLILSTTVSACAAPPTPVATPSAVPDQAAVEHPAPDLAIREGWTLHRDEANGFALAYPQTTAQPTLGGEPVFSLTLPADPSTNVVEESIAVRIVPPGQPCTSPLGYGFVAEDLTPVTVELGGLAWLRQTYSGVAAGTASTWVAYSTSRGDHCVSLDYTLRTFDPANLDPTRFPTPPVTVDQPRKAQDFEAIVATFTWLP
ncbi:MAG: hypothetical protein FJZ97_05700 [Chloroflexi bacterium]|nr:hypothetical protein [Chloroflexota bacterium]